MRRARIWRAHGIVGPSKKFGVVTQMRYRAPIFKHTMIRYFFRVGLCPTHVLPFAGDVDARRASDSIKTAEIAWTRVHAIIKSSTCSIGGLSKDDERLTFGHVTSREAPDLHQNKGRAITI